MAAAQREFAADVFGGSGGGGGGKVRREEIEFFSLANKHELLTHTIRFELSQAAANRLSIHCSVQSAPMAPPEPLQLEPLQSKPAQPAPPILSAF